jgi:hypothetical protein
MSKYMFQVNYVGEGIHGLLTEGRAKRHATEALAKSLGETSS